MSSFATVILSLFSPAISSSTGATILHGPHHSAQKSTTTVLPLLRTSLSKVASVTSTVFLPMVFSFVRDVDGQPVTAATCSDAWPYPPPASSLGTGPSASQRSASMAAAQPE